MSYNQFCVLFRIKQVIMKFLIVTFAMLAAFNCQAALTTFGRSSQSMRQPTSDTRYIQYLKERSQVERLRNQFEDFCPNKVDELDDTLLKIKECSDEIDENTETACSAIKNHFLRCSKPIVKLLEECLPEESKDVPNLIFQSVESGVSYLCKTDGEHIFELANTCVFKSNYRSMRCERRIKTKLQQYRNKPPTKTDICELAQSMKPCLHSHLQDSCGNQITRESFMGIFDALTAPCKTASFDNSQIEYNTVNEVELL